MTLNQGCPLCGLGADSSLIAEGAAGRREQLRILRGRLADLETGQITVERLRERIDSMCGMCQMLMISISSITDSAELRERIKKEIETLEKRLIEIPSQAA